MIGTIVSGESQKWRAHSQGRLMGLEQGGENFGSTADDDEQGRAKFKMKMGSNTERSNYGRGCYTKAMPGLVFRDERKSNVGYRASRSKLGSYYRWLFST